MRTIIPTLLKVIEVESLGAPIGPVKEGKTTATTTAATTTAATTTVATTAATTTAATTAATTTAATTTAGTTAVAGVVPTKAADLPSGAHYYCFRSICDICDNLG